MRTRVFAAAAVLAIGLAGCSSATDEARDDAAASQTEQAEAADGTVRFVGTDNLQWGEDTKQATLVDGALQVTIECEGAVPHNVVFEGVDEDAIIAACEGNDDGEGAVELEAGTYTYYCQIAGHRSAGMEGEITVS